MINRYVKNLLTAAITITLCNQAHSALRLIEDLGIRSAKRVYRCLPGIDGDSHKRLRSLKMNHFDKNHETIKTLMASNPLPDKVDLSAGFLPPFDQGDIGSCTANALVAEFCYSQKANGQPVEMMSRLYLYWQERYIRDKKTINQDTGATLADGILALQ